MLVVLVSASSASKEVVDWFGTASGNGSLGGEFNQPRDVALNSTGAGGVPAGTIYVADDNNHRIQRFSPSGEFVAAWGANVLTAPTNEVQTVTVNATAGTFTLSFGGTTTAPLAYNATAAQVQTALRALSTVGGANLSVSGTAPYTVTFNTTLQATNTPQLSADDSLLTGSIAVATTTQGAGKYEICTVASECLQGTPTGGANAGNTEKNGSLDNPQAVAVDNDTGDVYVSDRDNRRINVYSATGTFIRSFGWGVDATVAGSEYEVCPAANRCQFGIAGAGVGQLGATTTAGTYGIAVSPANGEAAVGKVFLADTVNRRVSTYNLDGTSPSSFGSSSNFAANQPRKVAVDSRGIVYASDSNSSAQIDRYDTENANGGGVGFIASISASAEGTPPNPLFSGPTATATSGLAVDPDSDGAGPDEDVLYVLRDRTSGNTVVQQFGPTNDPGLTAAPTTADDAHGASAGFNPVLGLGLNSANGKLYISATENLPGITGFPNRVYVLDNAPAPAVTLDPVTIFDAHSATFTGEVNPNGTRTGYHFEYVDDAEFNLNGFTNAAKFPLTDENLGSGTSSVEVEVESPHHLVPGTTYHVRLVAKQTFTATQTIGGPQTFTTPGASPSFHTAATAGEEEATLRAAIDPENQAVTNYHFQWGPTAAYGNSTPAGTLASGSEPVAVPNEALTGLTLGVEYHYRLVATNGTGTTTGPDETFTPTTAPQLPQRGYEIASQYPTGGVPIFELFGHSVSEDGDSVAITTTTDPLAHSTLPLLPDGPVQTGKLQYLFARGPDSWHRTEVGQGGQSWSGDLQRLLVETKSQALGTGAHSAWEDARLEPDDQNNSLDLYQWQPDGSLVWISRDPRIPAGTPQTASGDAHPAGDIGPVNPIGSFTMSADGRTVVFRSQRQLLDADTTPASGPSAGYRLYKWDDGQLSFIGKRPDGSVPVAGSMLADSANGTLPRYAVSHDGSRVIFSALRRDGVGGTNAGKTTGAGIYVQTDGEPTVEATKEEGVPPLPAPHPYNITYRGAAIDSSRVFFTSASRFTPDSGAVATSEGATDLYVYDVQADKLRNLTPRLDGLDDPTLDPALADQARVLGVAANSEDGKRVYFVAEGRYPTAPNPAGDLPQASSPNLYLAELDSIDDPVQLRFIGTLRAETGFGTGEEGDMRDWTTNWSNSSEPTGKTALASPDGSVLGFRSTESLTGQPLGGTAQLFVYDAEDGTLACPSCPSDSTLPVDDANRFFTTPGIASALWQPGALRRWVSDDGTVFFSTRTALLPADQNLVSDVYEFREGRLGLVTTGTGTSEAVFTNASVDGSTAFIYTKDALAPQDKEPGISKIYAARVGGGFPFVPPEEPCDFNAGACEGASSKAPETPGAGSAAFEGPGNRQKPAAKRCPKGKRKVRAKGKTRCVKRTKRNRNANHNRRAGR